MFDINYYNEKFKENLGSIGGSAPTEGETSWELWGSATGTNVITLPDEWEELHIISSPSGLQNVFECFINKEETLNKSQFKKGNTTGTYDRATWVYNNNTIKLNDLTVTDDRTSSSNTYVYYKKKSPITVNVGTESNWALWGSATDKNTISLPDEWEELKVVTIYDYVNAGANFRVTCTENIIKSIYENLKEDGYYNVISDGGRDSNHIINWIIDKTNKTIRIDSGNYTTATTYLYYKKKCDNVLDINDHGEWKLVGTVKKDTKLQLPTNFKELKVVSYTLGGSYAYTFQKIIGYEELKILSDFQQTETYPQEIRFFNSANDKYFALWDITPTLDKIFLKQLCVANADVTTQSYATTTVYYR